MTFTTRRILLVAMAAAITGMMATASGCAKRTQPSRPTAGAPDTPGTPETPKTNADAPVPALSVEDQVREAVFRYLFEHNASAMGGVKVYFLAIQDERGKQRDPSRAFMARFAGHRPRVEPASRVAPNSFEGVRHKDTGDRGLIFHVGVITRVSDDVMEVECGYYEANLSASGGTYRVERKDGVWVVTKPKVIWVA